MVDAKMISEVGLQVFKDHGMNDEYLKHKSIRDTQILLIESIIPGKYPFGQLWIAYRIFSSISDNLSEDIFHIEIRNLYESVNKEHSEYNKIIKKYFDWPNRRAFIYNIISTSWENEDNK